MNDPNTYSNQHAAMQGLEDDFTDDLLIMGDEESLGVGASHGGLAPQHAEDQNTFAFPTGEALSGGGDDLNFNLDDMFSNLDLEPQGDFEEAASQQDQMAHQSHETEEAWPSMDAHATEGLELGLDAGLGLGDGDSFELDDESALLLDADDGLSLTDQLRRSSQATEHSGPDFTQQPLADEGELLTEGLLDDESLLDFDDNAAPLVPPETQGTFAWQPEETSESEGDEVGLLDLSSVLGMTSEGGTDGFEEVPEARASADADDSFGAFEVEAVEQPLDNTLDGLDLNGGDLHHEVGLDAEEVSKAGENADGGVDLRALLDLTEYSESDAEGGVLDDEGLAVVDEGTQGAEGVDLRHLFGLSEAPSPEPSLEPSSELSPESEASAFEPTHSAPELINEHNYQEQDGTMPQHHDDDDDFLDSISIPNMFGGQQAAPKDADEVAGHTQEQSDEAVQLNETTEVIPDLQAMLGLDSPEDQVIEAEGGPELTFLPPDLSDAFEEDTQESLLEDATLADPFALEAPMIDEGLEEAMPNLLADLQAADPPFEGLEDTPESLAKAGVNLIRRDVPEPNFNSGAGIEADPLGEDVLFGDADQVTSDSELFAEGDGETQGWDEQMWQSGDEDHDVTMQLDSLDSELASLANDLNAEEDATFTADLQEQAIGGLMVDESFEAEADEALGLLEPTLLGEQEIALNTAEALTRSGLLDDEPLIDLAEVKPQPSGGGANGNGPLYLKQPLVMRRQLSLTAFSDLQQSIADELRVSPEAVSQVFLLIATYKTYQKRTYETPSLGILCLSTPPKMRVVTDEMWQDARGLFTTLINQAIPEKLVPSEYDAQAPTVLVADLRAQGVHDAMLVSDAPLITLSDLPSAPMQDEQGILSLSGAYTGHGTVILETLAQLLEHPARLLL